MWEGYSPMLCDCLHKSPVSIKKWSVMQCKAHVPTCPPTLYLTSPLNQIYHMCKWHCGTNHTHLKDIKTQTGQGKVNHCLFNVVFLFSFLFFPLSQSFKCILTQKGYRNFCCRYISVSRLLLEKENVVRERYREERGKFPFQGQFLSYKWSCLIWPSIKLW